MKKCRDCNKRLQHNNKTNYCVKCEEKYHNCKKCGIKISHCSWRRTGLCHSCGVRNNKVNDKRCECGAILHPNNKSGFCFICMTTFKCIKCHETIGKAAWKGTKKCHKCAVGEAVSRRKLPDEFCEECNSKLKTQNRSKRHLCYECSRQNNFMKKNCYVSGYFYSNKNKIEIFYASSFELKAFEILENNDDIISFNRCPYIIKYKYSNKIRKYYPDILVVKNKSKEIIEIKAIWELESEQWLAKAAAAKQFAKENNMIFQILTEKELFKEIE